MYVKLQFLSGGARRNSVIVDVGAGGENESTGVEEGEEVVAGRDIIEFNINANPLICAGCSEETLISIFSIPLDDEPRRIAAVVCPSVTEAAGVGMIPRRLRAGIEVTGS
jgi:hypothetical protein